MAINLKPIGTYRTGVFQESSAEIPAYDPLTRRLFVSNAQSASVDVFDLSDPTNPIKMGEIVGADFGGLVNSVTAKNGIVAVAVEANIKTDPGRAILFRTDADFSAIVQPEGNFPVGALPDSLVFTPDGKKIFVANEGEPNDDYEIDPEGSVTIIDISNGIANATVVTADFNAFDDRKEELMTKGVRIFGPNATVSQDLEPEWITFSADSKTAYVSLQENNAIGIIDVETNTVIDIKPLGFKDHNASPDLTTVFFNDAQLPVIGNSTTLGDVLLGGFSGLYFEGVNPDNSNLKFITHSDIGPSATGNRDLDGDGTAERVRIYYLPDLQPSVVRFEYNPNTGDIQLGERIFLTRQDGTPLTGLPNLASDDSARIPIDEDGNILDFDPLGADLEGIVVAPNGTFWMADEYRPAIYHFEADGTLINRFVPQGLPDEVGTGVFPEEYNTRQANRGFEAIALQDGKFYGFMQSPFNNPDSGETSTIRILEFDPATSEVVGEYLYLQEDIGGGSDKIGDAVATNKIGEFLVIERDSSISDDSQKVVFRINLDRATNLQTLPDGILEAGETFDSLTVAELAEKGINPVAKEVFADLNAIGYDFTDKPEGLAWINETTVAVINDNDFAEAGIPIGLGIITLNNAFDASDRDNAINIRNWPVFGMLLPDTIASYEVNGKTFIVTANEGDARDYDGFSEELRASRLLLDPVAFPNASELQANDQLGRLTVTNTLGMSDRAIFVAELDGSQEVPGAVTTEAEGEAFAWVDDNGFLQVELEVTELDFGTLTGNFITESTADDVTALHIHEALRGANGGFVWNILTDDDTVITIDEDGTANITSTWQENTIPKTAQGEDTEFYFNLHTVANPSGEIRGQIVGEVAYDEIYAFGTRSFSIFNSDIELVFDSGSQFEQIIAQQIADGILPMVAFNANHAETDSFDNRSDNKGPEPEGLAIGEVNGETYAFIGLERIGGVMVYNISNPETPEFIQYINNRNFVDENGNIIPNQLDDGSTNPAVGDLGAEGVIFTSDEDSPNGVPLVVVTNEVSGTTTIFEINVPTPLPFTLQLFHAADQEAGVPALDDIPRFSAVLNALLKEDIDNDGVAGFANTLILSSGDAYIPGLFFGASEDVFGGSGRADILIQNALGFQAIAFGNHEFDLNTAFVRDLIAGDAAENFFGTNFPYLSSNLDFSTDANLAGLVVADDQAPLPNSIAATTVIDVNGEKIGVVGATTPTIVSISSPGGITVNPQSFDGSPTPEQLDALAAEIQQDVDELIAANPGLNKVILLAHMQQIGIEQALATRLKNVDIIMAGGSNTRLVDETDRLRAGDTAQGTYPIITADADGTPVAIINTDGNYKYVGRLVIDFDANGVIIPESYNPTISGAYATDAQGVADLNAENLVDPEIQAIVDALRTVIVAKESNVFGISDVYLEGLRPAVRQQETNLGNLTADANLMLGKQVDPTVMISLKNGGGIRDDIGRILVPTGGTGEAERLPNEAVTDANGNIVKPTGGISETDIANALAFNNGLSLVTVTATELLALIEHGVAASTPTNQQGRFPQVSGLAFSFDLDRPAGDRILSLAIEDSTGKDLDTVVRNGEIVGNPNRTFRMVTLGFLADGGDGYPFPTGSSTNRVDLTQPNDAPRTGAATFAVDGSEQDALAEYLAANFNSPETAFNQTDTSPEFDTRIQNLAFRADMVLDPLQALITGTPLTDNLSAGQEFNGLNDLIFTGAGDDIVDVVIGGAGKGSNRINLGSGNDTVFVSNGDRANGGSGDDYFDASEASGYRLSGGKGNDIFYLGTGGRAIGGDGDDQFYVGEGGDNLLAGGAGADQFWLLTDNVALIEIPNTVTDFTQGVDVIGIMNQGAGVNFASLSFTGNSIALNGNTFATLTGVNTTTLTAADFVFM
jgi:2',3'-cyclic-nucleotide 2'-phosphodiesterase (5'-nucleotidase family)